MFKSLFRYFSYFFLTFFARKERVLLWRNIKAWFVVNDWKTFVANANEKKEALHLAAQWLTNNQTYNADKGYSTFYIVGGHTGSYPETSGYILDSLLSYSEKYTKKEMLSDLLQCADWLVNIQKESGGWQSGYVHENKKEVVFNTGQVIRGLLHAYRITKEKKYLNSCIKAGDWLCAIQETDGSWKKFAFMNTARVYDSYVDAPLLQLWKETNNDNYKKAAEKNIQWILNHQLTTNGWFNNCDNTIKHNMRPILHTIAYTLDGIIESAQVLQNKEYINKIKITAEKLLNLFEKEGYLWGRYDKSWSPSEALICTGGAQISAVWMKLFMVYGEKKWLHGAQKMNNLLVYIQRQTYDGRKEIKGALQGSFPLWGRYEPFAFPNWATKYFVDALLLEESLNEQH